MLFELLIKRTSRYTKAFSRFLDPASLLVQDPLDVLFFQLDQRQTSIEKGCAHLGMAVEVKVVEGDAFLVTQEHGPFDYVT